MADKYITSAQATTLAPGSQATASVADQVLTIGVPKGEKGDTPTVGIGEVTTLAPGEHATATVTETDTGVNINLGIPQGERGEAATAISYVDGEYVGLGERFAAMRDARVYGVTVHMDGGTVCEKTQDNVGLATRCRPRSRSRAATRTPSSRPSTTATSAGTRTRRASRTSRRWTATESSAATAPPARSA